MNRSKFTGFFRQKQKLLKAYFGIKNIALVTRKKAEKYLR
jgi:hypothetical protein